MLIQSFRAAALLFLISVKAGAQQPIERVSVDVDGAPLNHGCDDYAGNPVSDDGRYVAFSNFAGDVVPGDTNGRSDVFVRDRFSGTTARVSVASDGSEGNSDSLFPAMSGDGRFVAFASHSDDLVPDDTNLYRDAFLHDRDPDGNGIFDEGNATTIRISLKQDGSQADSSSQSLAMSRDGRIVVFESDSDLTPDAGIGPDLFAYDRIAGTIECVTLGSIGDPVDSTGFRASISADGSRVAFESYSSNLVSGDTRGLRDVFVFDRVAGVTTRVSVASDGSEADNESYDASISADGNVVVFMSKADNLVAVSDHYHAEVFAHDLATGATTLVSVAPDGTFVDGDPVGPVVSEDGRFVAFFFSGTTLYPLDKNNASDVFMVDRTTGAIEAISTDCTGFTANAKSLRAALSPDGRFVSFLSDASDLVGDGLAPDTLLYLRDRDVAWPEAARESYGAGWPGTLGEPTLTADVDPEYGAPVSVRLGNSFGRWTLGFLFLGFDDASIPTSKGGSVLVDVAQSLPLAIAPGGATLTGTIPFDETICGVELFLQGIEQDPGASRGIAFTAGLKLTIGR